MAGKFDAEYGTWQIISSYGTGMYKGWKGGGRWTAVTDGNYSIEWDGFVTH